jgi:dGTPase
MVKDLIKNTIINLKAKKIKSVNDVYAHKKQLVSFSNKFKEIESEVRYFLRLKMYDNKSVQIKNNKGKKIIKKLFLIVNKNPKKYLSNDQMKFNKHRAISDYISGMTDRYAINLYENTK